MPRIPARAALTLVTALACAAPASATAYEPTVVGYSSDAAAFISLVYRPVPTPDVNVSRNVTKADCLADYTGTGDEQSSTIIATFVAKVATNAQKEGGRPQDSIAVATGIHCELRDSRDDSVLFEWTTVRPGNAAADVYYQNVTSVRRPKICVEAWVIFGDGTELTIDKHCDRA